MTKLPIFLALAVALSAQINPISVSGPEVDLSFSGTSYPAPVYSSSALLPAQCPKPGNMAIVSHVPFTSQIYINSGTGACIWTQQGGSGGGGGSGTVTSVSGSTPLTGVITTSGFIACPTCAVANAALTNGQLLFGAGTQNLMPGNLTGDATTAGTNVLTLATVNGSPGTCGDSTHVCQVVINAKGLTTSGTQISIGGGSGSVTSVGTSGPLAGGPITSTGTLSCPTCITGSSMTNGQLATGTGSQGVSVGNLSGDVTTTGSTATTLATVNGSPGSCGDATHVCVVTVDAKGRTTSQSPVSIAAGSTNPYVANASGTCVGSACSQIITAATHGQGINPWVFCASGALSGSPSHLTGNYVPCAFQWNAAGSPGDEIVYWTSGDIGSFEIMSSGGTGGGGSGTVTSVSGAAPLNGTVTTTGSLSCPTCVTSAAALTSGKLMTGGGLQASAVADLTGDVTTSGSTATTLATVNGSPGTCGDATHVCQVTTNGKGLATSQTQVAITAGAGTVTSIATTGPITGGMITTTGTLACPTCVTSAAPLTTGQLVFGAGSQASVVGNLSGAVTTSGSGATTITTVNGSPGSCGDSTHVCQVVTNGPGQVTSQTGVAISAAPPTSGSALLAGNGTGGFATATVGNIFSLFTGCAGTDYPGFDGACHAPSGSGTVTSVGILMPTSVFANSGPVTTSGTLSATFVAQSPGVFLAGPCTGGSTVPTFRAICATDIAGAGTLTNSISGTSAGLNGVSMASLGTGLVKNTIGTGVPSIATTSDITALGAVTTTGTMSINGIITWSGSAIQTPNTTTSLDGAGNVIYAGNSFAAGGLRTGPSVGTSLQLTAPGLSSAVQWDVTGDAAGFLFSDGALTPSHVAPRALAGYITGTTATTLYSDVRNYGATCSGLGSNVHTAVVSLLTAGLSEIYIPSGCTWVVPGTSWTYTTGGVTYTIAAHAVPANLYIVGQNWNNSIISTCTLSTTATICSNPILVGPNTTISNASLWSGSCTVQPANQGAYVTGTSCPSGITQNSNPQNNGIVSTSGTSVTLVAGVPFVTKSSGNYTWTGGGTNFALFINGTAYTVSSVSSGTSLTLTTSAGTQTNVPYIGNQYDFPLSNGSTLLSVMEKGPADSNVLHAELHGGDGIFLAEHNAQGTAIRLWNVDDSGSQALLIQRLVIPSTAIEILDCNASDACNLDGYSSASPLLFQSSYVTSGNIFQFEQDTTTYTGNVIDMNMGTGGGASNFTGNFINFSNLSTPVWKVDYTGKESCKTGTATASCGLNSYSSGSFTISNSSLGPNDSIELSINHNSGTVGTPYVSSMTAGTGFTVTSSIGAADTSTIFWRIVTRM